MKTKKDRCNRKRTMPASRLRQVLPGQENSPGKEGPYSFREETGCDLSKEEIPFLNQRELLEYEAEVPMTPAERRALRKWVSSGHSVYEHPGSQYICLCGAWPPPDFLSVYRMDQEICKDLKGKTKAEREAYLKAYTGCDESAGGDEKNGESLERAKDQLRKLKREFFYIWDYIGREGLWSEAQEYIEQNRDEPVPFED